MKTFFITLTSVSVVLIGAALMTVPDDYKSERTKRKETVTLDGCFTANASRITACYEDGKLVKVTPAE